MKSLKLIQITIDTMGILMIVGIAIVIVVFVTLPEDVYIAIGNPSWKITSEKLDKFANEEISKKIGPNNLDTSSGMVFTVENLQMSLPIHLGLRIIIVTMALLVAFYIGYILWIMQEIIKDIRKKTPFNAKNTKRVKMIGILVTIAPMVEWLLQAVFSIWVNGQYNFDGLKLVNNSNLGLPVLFLGLLIMAVGVAFEQGNKIQEENELTI